MASDSVVTICTISPTVTEVNQYIFSDIFVVKSIIFKTLIIFCHFGTKYFLDRVNQEMTGINQG